MLRLHKMVFCASIASAVAALAGGCSDDDVGSGSTTGASTTAGAGGGGGQGGQGTPLAMTCGLAPITQATATGSEACDPIEPRCPAAPATNYRNVFKIGTCSFNPSLGETDCEVDEESICATAHGADLGVVLADPSSTCAGPIGSLDISVGEPAADGAILGHWELSEYSAEPECAPLGETDSGTIDLGGVCCEVLVDAHLPLHDQVFRFRVQRDWEEVATNPSDGGTSTSCPDVCAHVMSICTDLPPGCEESCAGMGEARRVLDRRTVVSDVAACSDAG